MPRLESEREMDPAPMADWRLSFERGLGPKPDLDLFAWPGRYGLTLGRAGDDLIFAARVGGVFVISAKDRRLRCFVDNAAPDAWLDVLARRILPRTCIIAGALAIHAASVARHGGALMLAATSGAGKSTLSAALERDGWSLLSDDISVVWPHAKQVAPTVSGAGLWPESRQGLNLSEAQCRPMAAYDGKKAYLSGGEREAEPTPLKAVIGLVRSTACEKPRLEALAPRETLRLLQQHIIYCSPKDHDEQASAFAELGEMATTTAGYRMTFPSRYDALPDVARELEALLG